MTLHTVRVSLSSYFQDLSPYNGLMRFRLNRKVVTDDGVVFPLVWQTVDFNTDGEAYVELIPNELLGLETAYIFEIRKTISALKSELVASGGVFIPDHDCDFLDVAVFKVKGSTEDAATAQGYASQALASARSAAESADLAIAAANTVGDDVDTLKAQVVQNTSAIGDNASAISSEKDRATGAEAQISDVLSQLGTRVDTLEQSGSGQDSVEIASIKRQITNLRSLLCTSYDDTSEAYAKAVPSGAAPWAEIKSVGGRTLVWNQLFKPFQSATLKGITVATSDGYSFTVSGTFEGRTVIGIGSLLYAPIGHKILFLSNPDSKNRTFIQYFNDNNSYVGEAWPNNGMSYRICEVPSLAKKMRLFQIIDGYEVGSSIDIVKGVAQIIDLTLMFGSGNEPTTVEEVEAVIGTGYHPYNAGELVSGGVTMIVSGVASKPIPAAIRALPEYGTEGTLIDVVNKKYVNNGQETDILDLLPEDWGHIEVEPGGVIEFRSTTDFRIPVPSTITYQVRK